MTVSDASPGSDAGTSIVNSVRVASIEFVETMLAALSAMLNIGSLALSTVTVTFPPVLLT